MPIPAEELAAQLAAMREDRDSLERIVRQQQTHIMELESVNTRLRGLFEHARQLLHPTTERDNGSRVSGR